MKQIELGMLNYEATRRAFPAAVSYAMPGGKRSKYPHSWRIDVLPFVEEVTIGEQYRLDEPWDSEANKNVLAKMPSVFRSPFDPDPHSVNTSYFVFDGPGAIFNGEERTQIKTITDGTSLTIALIEAKRAVPWTKPEDIPFAADKPLPKLEGWLMGRLMVGLADGSVLPISSKVEESLLKAYITKAGSETPGQLPRIKEDE